MGQERELNPGMLGNRNTVLFFLPCQIQYHPIQEFHYLPKTFLQLNSQYLLNSNKWRQQLQPRLHTEQQHLLWQQASVLI